MRTIADLLHAAAFTGPDRIAVSDSTRFLDYSAMERIAGAVAALLTEAGFVSGEPVAIRGVRDARLLAVFLAVMRVGGAACVVGSDWSESVVRRRLQAIAPRCVLTTDAGCVESIGPIPQRAVDIDDLLDGTDAGPPPPAVVVPSQPAYLTFTTGSSGAPKAVVVSHANAVHYALGLRTRLAVSETDTVRLAQVTTLAADLGYTSVLLALAAAGHVVVVDDAMSRNPHEFWKLLAQRQVTGLKTTPSHLKALLEGRTAGTIPLDTLILGGEPLSRAFAVRLFTDGVADRVVNHYGPTETTVGTACFIARGARDLPTDEATVPIGSAIGETVLRLDRGGELVVAGPGVARYHGEGGDAAGGFAVRDQQRAFRTGDLCRRRDDGNLVFLGRKDRQVKISGYRVDPDEVEHLLGAHPAVTEVAVVVGERGTGPRLMAAVCLRSADPDAGAAAPGIRRYLRDHLPPHAIPSAIVPVAALPIGPNGKLDRRRIHRLLDDAVDARAMPAKAPPRSVNDLAQLIALLWAEALGVPAVDHDADMGSLGGDSILAMRTLALLRRHGAGLTVDDVYQHPTPALLAAASQRATRLPDPPSDPSRSAASLGPAQRWFFGQALTNENHWNQTVVLSCAVRVHPGALVSAIGAVLQRHPVLRWPVNAAGPEAAPRPVDELEPVSFSFLTRDDVPATISGVGDPLNRSLDLAAGRLLCAHLFRGDGAIQDRLALVVHHAVIDTVSWRTVLADLATAYRAAVTGCTSPLPPIPDYYRWTATQPDPPSVPTGPALTAPGGPVALVWSLDRLDTERILRRYPLATALQAALLSAFADAVAEARGDDSVAIEVETHGRGSGTADAAYVETVGWFTAVKWITVTAAAGVAAVERAVRVTPSMPMDATGSRPRIGFNFLGTFRVPAEPLLDWTPSDEIPGPARCADGDPLYALRLTARIVDDRLVTDIVYQPSQVPDTVVHKVYQQFAATIAVAADAVAAPVERSSISTSGIPLLTGASSAAALPVRVGREPAHVVLTGGTGYLGGQVLTELINAGARVTCLVRTAQPDLPSEVRRGAVEIVVGDVTQDALGLCDADNATARRGLTGVIHAAGDVRLAAPLRELEATNVEGLRRLLSWIDDGAVVPLHHVSTLAVAGVVDGAVRRFSEADLCIGQRFLSPYERSKFAAELLMRSWSQRGNPAFIYRMGHVAAHSRTGAFQRNAADNRIYQTLHGYIAARCAPLVAAAVAFSHVDTVAAGLVAIALGENSAPGVYHLESPHDVGQSEIVGWLRSCGHDVELVDGAAFERAVQRLAVDDPDRAYLLNSWSGHADRNIRFDRSRTLAELARRRVQFTRPSAQWGRAAIRWAMDKGALPQPTAPQLARG